MSLWQEPHPAHLGGAVGGLRVFASEPFWALFFRNVPQMVSRKMSHSCLPDSMWVRLLPWTPQTSTTRWASGRVTVCEGVAFRISLEQSECFVTVILPFFRSLGNGARQGRGEMAAFLQRNEAVPSTLCPDNLLPLQTRLGKPGLLRPGSTLTCSCRRMNSELQPTSSRGEQVLSPNQKRKVAGARGIQLPLPRGF